MGVGLRGTCWCTSRSSSSHSAALSRQSGICSRQPFPRQDFGRLVLKMGVETRLPLECQAAPWTSSRVRFAMWGDVCWCCSWWACEPWLVLALRGPAQTAGHLFLRKTSLLVLETRFRLFLPRRRLVIVVLALPCGGCVLVMYMVDL